MESVASRPRLVPALAALGLLAAATAAQGRRLNDLLVRPLGGDIRSLATSPDGTRVVYIADQDQDEVFELFSAPTDAPGTRVKLAGPHVAGGDVRAFAIGPRGRNVALLGDLDVAGQISLYSAPIDGGTLVRLGDLPGVPLDLAFDPIGSSVLLRVQVGATEYGLFRIPLSFGPATRLDAGGGVHGVETFRISPDARFVAYVSDQAGNPDDLFSVPLNGGSSVQLNPPRTEVDYEALRADAVGDRVLFLARELRAWPYPQYLHWSLYSAEPGSGARQELVPDFVDSTKGLQLSAGGERAVVILYNQLVSAPVDASQPFAVLYEFPRSTWPGSFETTPDGRTVVFSEIGGSLRLFSVPVDGSSAALEIDSGVDEFVLSPDSLRAVATHTPGNALFRSALDGSEPPLQIGANATEPRVTPDSARVLFLAPVPGTAGDHDLFSVPISGASAPTRVNDPLPYGGTVPLETSGAVQPDALGRVLYLASQAAPNQFELFSAPSDASTPPFRINAALPLGPVAGDVLQSALSPDGVYAVYRADQETDDVVELFRVRLDRPGESLRLSRPLAPGEDVTAFSITPDSRRVAYWIKKDTDVLSRLLSVSIDGGESTSLGSFNRGQAFFAFDPASTRAVFPDVTGALLNRRILSVPLDGSAAAITIAVSYKPWLITPDGRLLFSTNTGLCTVPVDGSAAPVAFGMGAEDDLVLDASGTRVVYSPGFLGIYASPVDGSAPLLPLIPTRQGFFRSSRPAVTRDGWVLFVGDLDVQDRLELYRVSIDGGVAPIKVSAPLVDDGDVEDFLVSPDGKWAVYRADQERDGHLELFGVPVDGSGPVRKLSGPLGGGEVSGGASFRNNVYAISADGARVVFRANPLGGTERRLFSAPIDGSGRRRLLSAPTTSLEGINAFAIAPDASKVVYSEQEADHAFRLFETSLDGVRQARAVSGRGEGVASAFKGDIGFSFTSDSSRVLFVSDQAAGEAFELFSSKLLEAPSSADERR